MCFLEIEKLDMCFLEIEKLDMCLSHEIKSFDLKNIIFLSTKKMVFDNRKIRSIFFFFYVLKE